MSETLSERLRPRSFEQFLGQTRSLNIIRTQVVKGERFPLAWLLYGEAGSGKTSLARVLALSYQRPLEELISKFGLLKPADWKNYHQHQIQEIDSADYTGVDAIRAITSQGSYMPQSPSFRRVFILDEAHCLTANAQRALLKPTEQGPAIWILCTTEPGKIIKTLKDRCYSVLMKPLSEENIKKLLVRAVRIAKFSGKLDPLLKELLSAEVIYPRAVLGAAEKFFSGAKPGEAVLGEESDLDVLEVCRAVYACNWERVRSQIQGANASALRSIRLTLLSYLRSCLLGENKDLSDIAYQIRVMAEPIPPEDPAASAVITQRLFQCCVDEEE